MDKAEEITIQKTDRYLTLVSIGHRDNDTNLVCEEEPLSAWRHIFCIDSWDFGYDFFETFEYNYKSIGSSITDKDKLLNTYIYLAQKIEKWKKRKAPQSIR